MIRATTSKRGVKRQKRITDIDFRTPVNTRRSRRLIDENINLPTNTKTSICLVSDINTPVLRKIPRLLDSSANNSSIIELLNRSFTETGTQTDIKDSVIIDNFKNIASGGYRV